MVCEKMVSRNAFCIVCFKLTNKGGFRRAGKNRKRLISGGGIGGSSVNLDFKIARIRLG